MLVAPYGGGVWANVCEDIAPVADLQIVEPGDETDLDDMARRVLQLAPARFHLAGLCMGGYLALAIHRLAPGRVSGLALINTSAAPDGETQARVRQTRIEKLTAKSTQTRLSESDYIAHAVNWLLGPAGAASLAVVQAAKALLAETSVLRSLSQQKAMLARADSRPFLADIAVPTLVVGGELDRVCPPSRALEIARGIPNAGVQILEGCGHLSPLESPRELATAMIRWVGRATPVHAANHADEEQT